MEQEFDADRADALSGGWVTRVEFGSFDDVEISVSTKSGEFVVRLGSDFYADIMGEDGVVLEFDSPDPNYNRVIHFLRRVPEFDWAMAEVTARYEFDDALNPVPTQPHKPAFCDAIWSAEFDAHLWDIHVWANRPGPAPVVMYGAWQLPQGDPGAPDLFLTSYDSDGSSVTGTLDEIAPLLRAALRPDEWDTAAEQL